MIQNKQQLILKALAQFTAPKTTKELYQLEPFCSVYETAEALCSTLTRLREKKLIANGISEYRDNRTWLTWEITELGKTELESMPDPEPVITGELVTALKLEINGLLDRYFAAPEIEQKDLKIAALEKASAILSEDIKALFLDLAEDLRKL